MPRAVLAGNMQAVHKVQIKDGPWGRQGRHKEVKVLPQAAAPINPSDLASLEGRYANRKQLPTVPGIEGSGTVVAAGPGLLPRLLLGRQVACASSPDAGGTWAEYMVTVAAQCVPLRRGVTLEQGATLLVNPLTALSLWDIALGEGHAAVVHTAAASSLGRMILRVGVEKGVPQICVVRRPEHEATLRALGAEHVLVSTDRDFVDRLRALSHELRATLFLDPVAGEGAARLLQAAPAGSTLIVYADLAAGPSASSPGSCSSKANASAASTCRSGCPPCPSSGGSG